MYGVLFQTEALLSLKNAWLPTISFLDTKSTCQVLLSPNTFKPRKNIPELVGITHRKPEYLKMRRTYAQKQIEKDIYPPVCSIFRPFTSQNKMYLIFLCPFERFPIERRKQFCVCFGFSILRLVIG